MWPGKASEGVTLELRPEDRKELTTGRSIQYSREDSGAAVLFPKALNALRII